MRSLVRLASFAAVALVAMNSVAFAHPGHGGGWIAGLVHPFSGLDHALAMVAVGLWAAQLGRPAIWLLPAVFPVVMAIGALLAVNGVTLPWVEVGIIASVVVFGGAVAFQVRWPLAASAALISLFALLHGHTHGTELPANGSALLYGAGFVAATLALHGIGIGVGILMRSPVALRTTGAAIAAVGLALIVLH